MALPQEVWLKTHFFQDGPYLRARTYLVAAGNPEVFTVSVDLRPIAKAVIAYHKKLHSELAKKTSSETARQIVSGCIGCGHEQVTIGLFGGIAKMVKSVAKNKLVAGVVKATKSVVKATVLRPAQMTVKAVTKPGQAMKSVTSAIKNPKALIKSEFKQAMAPVNATVKAAAPILKSKVAAGIVAAAAVVYPPVGVPAAAAFAAANATLAAIEKGQAVATQVTRLANAAAGAKNVQGLAKNLASQVTKSPQLKAALGRAAPVVAKLQAAAKTNPKARAALKKVGPAVTKMAAQANPKAAAALKKITPVLQKAKQVQKVAKAVVNTPKVATAIKTATQRKQIAQKTLRTIAANAQMSTDPAKKAEAQKAAKIVALVAQSRARQAAAQPVKASQAQPGLVVDNYGRISKGKFRQGQAQKGAGLQLMLSARGQYMPGYWQRVGGCIGCG